MKEVKTWDDIEFKNFPVKIKQHIYLSMQPYISLHHVKFMREIEKEYPDWFPYETKYNSIPEYVHKAFKDECYPCKTFTDTSNRKSFFDELNNPPEPSKIPKTADEFMEMLSATMMFKLEQEEKQREEHKRVKTIWDKHYKKYGLEYRE